MPWMEDKIFLAESPCIEIVLKGVVFDIFKTIDGNSRSFNVRVVHYDSIIKYSYQLFLRKILFMYRIKTQNGELVNALSFHFDGHSRKIYADVKKDKEFKLEDCVVCGEYGSRARVLEVFKEMTEKFKTGNDSRKSGDFVFMMPEK